MKFFNLLLILSFSVVICAESEETSRYSRYEGACPGNIDDVSKSFGSFVQKNFNTSEPSILSKCQPEYFTNYETLESSAEADNCVVCVLAGSLSIESCAGVYVGPLPLETAVQRCAE